MLLVCVVRARHSCVLSVCVARARCSLLVCVVRRSCVLFVLIARVWCSCVLVVLVCVAPTFILCTCTSIENYLYLGLKIKNIKLNL